MMKKMWCAGLVAVVGLGALCGCQGTKPMLVIGHRGDSQAAPENTLASFRGAIAKQADYVELDSRASADGTLYVLHDGTVDRTTDAVQRMGGKEIQFAKLTDAQIDALDAGAWFGAKFVGERIPRLAEALDVIQASSQTLLERKAGTAEAHARLLRQKGLIGKLVVQSFDWKFLEELHKLEPNQPLAVLGDKEFDQKRWDGLPATGAQIVAWKHTDLPAELIQQLHARGYKVFAWTADELADWQRLAAAGVDGIITNRPGQLREALSAGKLAGRCVVR
jgi:glycerophosphoryl diester phosphodiesterase